ncbi:LacI family transcriptional regulator, partial [Rhizobium ruizarguesonis]
ALIEEHQTGDESRQGAILKVPVTLIERDSTGPVLN